MGLQLISCSPRLRIDIRAEKPIFTAQGHPAGSERALFVQFYPGGNVPPDARELVATLPGFWAGVGRDEDPYTTRLGWWDSEAAQKDYDWSDEDREYVEQRILQIGDPNVLVLKERVVDAPYANWAKHRKTAGKRTIDHVLADIGKVFEAAGFDVEQAVAHERQNGNDPRVVEFLYSLAQDAGTESEVEEVVAA